MSKYFVKRDEKVYGPYTIEQLKNGLKSKKLSPMDFAGLSENGPWLALGTWLKDGDKEKIVKEELKPKVVNKVQSQGPAETPSTSTSEITEVSDDLPAWIKVAGAILLVFLLTYFRPGCSFGTLGGNQVQAKLLGEWYSVDDSNGEKLASWICFNFRPDGTVTQSVLGTPQEGTYSVSGNTVTTNIQGRSASWTASFSGAYMYIQFPDRRVRFIGGN
jgi:hypothetical protein